MQHFTLLLASLFLLLPAETDAQRYRQQRFKAGFILGMTASQIDGDDQKGYEKIGLAGGLRGIARLTPRLDFNVELLYSQRGSKPSPKGTNGERPVDIRLNYAETPFLLTYKFSEDWDGNHRLQLSGGFSYARLLSSKVKESGSTHSIDGPGIAGKEDEFRKNDISWKIGLAYFITSHLSLGLRHTFSFTPILEEEISATKSNNTLRPYYVSVQLAYVL